MEIIYHSQSPQKKKKKRTFIASMNKYNPYRICAITESVYDRILLNRELTTETKLESPRDPKAIYLPPVRIEENSKKVIKKPTRRRTPWSPPGSVDSTPKGGQMESFQLLSKSLDLNYPGFENPQTGVNQNKNSDTRGDKKAATWKIRTSSGGYYNERHRTMSAFQERDGFKIPSKFKENKSPWVFQASRFFQV